MIVKLAGAAGMICQNRLFGFLELQQQLGELEVVEATVEPTTTALYGCLPDEAALHGVLNRVHSLGLRLVEVRRLKGDAPRMTGTTSGHR